MSPRPDRPVKAGRGRPARLERELGQQSTWMVKRRFAEEASGEEYIHKVVWRVVKRQVAHVEANPKGALMDDLVALVFASHALEGYANFLGAKIAPDLWANERELFRNSGLDGKLVVLHERCGLTAPEKGRRPYSTVRELKRLRDGIAHPKTIVLLPRRTEYVEGKEPPLFARGYLEQLVGHERALRAMEDVKAIADRLHGAAMARFPNKHLIPNALEGILSMRSTSTRLKE